MGHRMLTEIRDEHTRYTVNHEHRIHGVKRVYRLNKQLISYVTYDNGIVNGLVKYYHRNGRRESLQYMRGSQYVSEVKKWDKRGNLKFHRFYTTAGVYVKYGKVSELVQDIENITDDEKLIIMLTLNVKCL